jgi:hypothetical protein
MSENTSASGNITWHISRTCDSGACVGVARRGEVVLIGNTNNPESPVTEFTIDEWRQFLAGAKLGDFDSIACF